MNLQDNIDRSNCSIDLKDMEGISPVPYGASQLKEADAVTGHISNSTLWLFDTKKNRLQTMMRLAASKNGQRYLFDVYSDIVKNPYDRQAETLNVKGTIPSRDANVVKLIKEGYEILGWVDIHEIDTHKVPSY